tara:strand:- start:37 stop:183 length:147 start_codon:yes stop_codon:yes gene_type:complete
MIRFLNGKYTKGFFGDLVVIYCTRAVFVKQYIFSEVSKKWKVSIQLKI